ncbi:hypothetical protein J6590_061531 [Homalodisca vitripennis]|nr:hypothetical protein J6590_061531 [Homalodisca vitripennis]
MASLEVFLQDFGKDFLQEEDGGEKGIVQKDERLFKMLFGTQTCAFRWEDLAYSFPQPAYGHVNPCGSDKTSIRRT